MQRFGGGGGGSPRADRGSRTQAESEVRADMELHLTVIDFGYAALFEASGNEGASHWDMAQLRLPK